MIRVKYNKLTIIEEAPPKEATNGYMEDYVLVECDCGNKKVIRKYSVVKGKTKSCGCLQKERASLSSKIHGHTKHPFYMRWYSMLDRCTNVNSTSYPNYGGRGIEVCERWSDKELGFINFIEDMGIPEDKLTLDRINVNLGYFKENCRWADYSVQGFNKRPSGKTKSGVVGVYWLKSCNKWEASIKKDGKKIYLGIFEDIDEAISCRKLAEIELFGEESVKYRTSERFV